MRVRVSSGAGGRAVPRRARRRERVKPIGLAHAIRCGRGGPALTPRSRPRHHAGNAASSRHRQRRRPTAVPGCGRDRCESTKPIQRRVGLAVEGRSRCEGALILDAKAMTGAPHSGTFSPSLQRPIAMGYVAAALSAPGSALKLEQRGKIFDAIVTQMPFVPHRYHRKPAGA